MATALQSALSTWCVTCSAVSRTRVANARAWNTHERAASPMALALRQNRCLTEAAMPPVITAAFVPPTLQESAPRRRTLCSSACTRTGARWSTATSPTDGLFARVG